MGRESISADVAAQARREIIKEINAEKSISDWRRNQPRLSVQPQKRQSIAEGIEVKRQSHRVVLRSIELGDVGESELIPSSGVVGKADGILAHIGGLW